MSVHLRPATTADRQAILDLMRAGDYNRINLNPTCFLVAEGQGDTEIAQQIIAIGQIKRHWDGTPELASLVVAETQRRQGIGGAIVQALVDRHFAQPSAGTLYLFCLSVLEPYYQQFGFERVDRRQLPWPLLLMHLLGNGLGRLVAGFGGAAFTVIAMKIDTLEKCNYQATPSQPPLLAGEARFSPP